MHYNQDNRQNTDKASGREKWMTGSRERVIGVGEDKSIDI